MQSRIWLASAFLVSCLYQPAVTGTTLQFAGSNVFASDVHVVTDVGFDVIFSNFTYLLNGVAIPVSPQIRFFASDLGGMLDIGFSNTADADMDPVTGLAFIGPVMFTGSTSAPVLQSGAYFATGGAFWVDSSAVALLSGTVVAVEPVSDTSVPEPDTLVEILGAGLCFATAAIVRRTRES